jgi:hypothetical protein
LLSDSNLTHHLILANQDKQEVLPFSPLTSWSPTPPRHMATKLTLFQAFHLIKAVSVLLNFSQEEENMLKETLEYKVGSSGLLLRLSNNSTQALAASNQLQLHHQLSCFGMMNLTGQF